MSVADSLKFDAEGLLTVVVQDRLTGRIRMLAHANAQAIEHTMQTGRGTFYSRTRRALWVKGEQSGNTLAVHEIWADCDGDALVYLVDPAGPSCHTGRITCFFRQLDGESLKERSTHAAAALPALFSELEARKAGDAGTSYTKKLLEEGVGKIGDKIREEADELAHALSDESDERVISEAGDVIYHLLVGLLARDLSLRDVEAELANRFGVSGLAEKASRKK